MPGLGELDRAYQDVPLVLRDVLHRRGRDRSGAAVTLDR